MNCPHCNKPISIQVVGGKGASSSPKADSSDVGELLAQIYDDELEIDFERNFVTDLRARFEKYGEKLMMSEKQMNVLRKIAAK